MTNWLVFCLGEKLERGVALVPILGDPSQKAFGTTLRVGWEILRFAQDDTSCRLERGILDHKILLFCFPQQKTLHPVDAGKNSTKFNYTMPYASIAFATLMNPAMFAPTR